MTKKEIVKAISEDLGLTQLQTKQIVQKTFDAIVETLVTEGRIELRNFGVFEVKRRAARKARNPRTGVEVEVSEKFVVTFKPGKYMEERVLEVDASKIPHLKDEKEDDSEDSQTASAPSSSAQAPASSAQPSTTASSLPSTQSAPAVPPAPTGSPAEFQSTSPTPGHSPHGS